MFTIIMYKLGGLKVRQNKFLHALNVQIVKFIKKTWETHPLGQGNVALQASKGCFAMTLIFSVLREFAFLKIRILSSDPGWTSKIFFFSGIHLIHI